MHLRRLSTSNFKKLRGDNVWEFSDGIIGIVGHNGKGKSTIMNAVAWTLYGPEAIPGTKANVISWGENATSVSVEIEVDDKPYTITRSQKATGAGDASVFSGTEQIAQGLDPVTRTVADLLGVDRTGFLISVYSRQEELAGLSSLTPSSRMRTVMKLRGISKVDDAIESVRAGSREKKRDLSIIRTVSRSAPTIRKDISELESTALLLGSSLESRRAGLETCTSNIREFEGRLAGLVKQAAAYRTYQDAYDRADHDVRWQRHALRGAETAATAPAPADPGAPPPQPPAGRLLHLMSDRQTHQQTLEAAKSALANKQTICPCCHRPYENAESLEQHRVELKASVVEEAGFLMALDAAINVTVSEGDAYDGWLKSHQDWRDWSSRNDLAQGAIKKLHVQLQEAIKARDAIEEVYDCTGELNDVRDYLASYKNSLADIRVDIATITERQRATAADLAEAKADLAEAEVSETAAKALETETVALDVTATELMGMKEDLIGLMIPALNSAASRFIAEMTDGRYSDIRLTADYEMQYTNDLGDWQPFETLSGGEQDVFALALRLALSEISAERIGVLFLDEVVESLDPDRQESVWNALLRLTKRYEQIFLVTHVPEFKERAPQTITL